MRPLRCLPVLGSFLALLLSTLGPAAAESSPPPDSVTLAWEEFRGLLNLDESRIILSWEEFKQLAAQASPDTNIAFTLDEGKVVLTREQFRQLLGQMTPPPAAEAKPPRDVMLLSADYAGTLDAAGARFRATFELEVFPADHPQAFRTIPLFREELALEEVRLDGRPVSLVTADGWQKLVTNQTGRHTVFAVFSVPSKLSAVSGLDFSIPETPITHVSLWLPKPGMEVHVSNARSLVAQDRAAGTWAGAFCLPGSRLQITWRKRAGEQARGPVKIYADLNHLLSVEADAIRVTTQIKLNVLQNSLSSLSLLVPPDYQVLDVAGQDKQTWHVDAVAGRQVLTIPFDFPLEGQHTLTVHSERLLPRETMVAEFTGFQVLDAMRESGYIAGEVKSDAEATVREVAGGETVDFQKIPSELSGLSSRPLLFACRYVRHPYRVVVDITKHAREEALSAVIDLAQGATLLQAEGKLTHRLLFTVRNMWKQFLKLKLPEGARIWSVFVDGKREKASQDAEGRILIPLARSQRNGGELQPFTVELIYTEPAKPLSPAGGRALRFPAADLLINRLQWDVFLPVDFRFPFFQGDLKREPVAQAPAVAFSSTESFLNLPAAPPRGAEYDEEAERDDGEDYKDKEVAFEAPAELAKKALPQPEVQASMAQLQAPPPVMAKARISRQSKIADQLMGSAGLMSVQVNVPFYGCQVRFSKAIVDPDEKLRLSFAYLNEWLAGGFWFLLLAGLGILAYRFRQPLGRGWDVTYRFLAKAAPFILAGLRKLRFILSPIGLPVAMFLLAALIRWLYPQPEGPVLAALALVILAFLGAMVRLCWKPIRATARWLWRPYSLSVFLLLILLAVLRLRAVDYEWQEFEYFWLGFILAGLLWVGSLVWSALYFMRKRKHRLSA